MARERRPRVRIGIRLSAIDDLFRAPDPARFAETGRLISGIDELLLALRARRLPRRLHAVITLAGGADIGDARAADLVRGWCDIRLRDLDVELRAQHREQVRSLLIGLLLFWIGLGLSSEFTQSYWPEELKTLLGDGVFLVIAWVGLWYPLDSFVFGRRALLKDRKVLRVVRDATVEVRREHATPAPAAAGDAGAVPVTAGGRPGDATGA